MARLGEQRNKDLSWENNILQIGYRHLVQLCLSGVPLHPQHGDDREYQVPVPPIV